MSELCHTPGSGLRHTISFKPLTNPMRRNEHYRHLLMREVEGREELSLFFFFFGTLTLERGLQQQWTPDLKLFGSM